MKKLAGVLGAIALATIGTATRAAADEPSNIYEVTEAEDALLHEKCAYLGTMITKDERARMLDGEVAVLVAFIRPGERLVKHFACKEMPAFYKESWKPAECASFVQKERAKCEAKWPPPPPPPPAPPPSASEPAPASAPPAPPSPPVRAAKSKRVAKAPVIAKTNAPGY